jgi:hypothetical protein
MSMRVYPNAVYNSIINHMKLGPNLVRNVTFNFKENPHNIMILKSLMFQTHLAIVQPVGAGAVPSCPLRALFLFWDNAFRQFMGYIPLEQVP